MNGIKTIMKSLHGRFFVCACLCAIVFACEKPRKELIDEALYEGPIIEMDSVFTQLSDSGKMVMYMRAKKQFDYENDDREWPEGMYLEYLDDEGNIESTFKADRVYYTAETNIYKGEGNVVVQNMETNDELTTELLFWSPSEKRFYTDRFVTIVSDDEVHTGEGLDADEDFTSYTITKPAGTISIEENEAD